MSALQAEGVVGEEVQSVGAGVNGVDGVSPGLWVERYPAVVGGCQ